MNTVISHAFMLIEGVKRTSALYVFLYFYNLSCFLVHVSTVLQLFSASLLRALGFCVQINENYYLFNITKLLLLLFNFFISVFILPE